MLGKHRTGHGQSTIPAEDPHWLVTSEAIGHSRCGRTLALALFMGTTAVLPSAER